MATYQPQQVGVTPPPGGFQELGWYNGRQYSGGTLSEPGVIHPNSPQQGAGQAVSAEVNAQSAAQQGVSPQQFESYLQQQRQQPVSQPQAVPTQSGYAGGTVASSGSMSSGGSVALGSMQPTPTLNLPNLYQSLYDSSGISAIEADLSSKEKQYIEAKGKINDNPFLSEATRVGRVRKLDQLYNENTASLRNDIAMKKADIETKLALETKQFDINSQASQQALSQFNALLSSGALAGASGEDIANITRMTGLSSSMIQSAIGSSKAKSADTQVITSTDDRGVVTATIIDKQTGNIISQQNLGAIGNAQTSGGGSATAIKAQEEAANRDNLIASIKNYNNLSDIVGAFSSVFSEETIYDLYNLYSPFGPANESLDEVTSRTFTVR